MASDNRNVLAELSTRLSAAVAQVGEHVVAIHARRRIPSSGVIWRDGVIVSASHTVRRDGDVRVRLSNGDDIQARVAGRDAATDLVVLRATDLKAQSVPRADVSAATVGSLVLAVGRPGRNVTASFGIVSADIEGWRGGLGARLDHLLRLDLAVYDGFSGGPLIAASGGIIGINNSAFARGGAATLPASIVDSVVDELLTRGHIRRPFIGVGVHPVALGSTLVERNKLTHNVGLVVISIADSEPADVAGILLGDVLVAVEGRYLEQPSDLVDALSSVPDGGSIRVTALRGGVAQEIIVEPRDRDREGAAA
ncbi:MAG TPA: trypsin-like peptidase domain-containing protein [Gemmatimonadaceae bacterium]|jgi:S1-C subfamily serine protease|nr:trypsin-like peptidase domain-containing protein [Gemmatimonadaceae bacterium]